MDLANYAAVRPRPPFFQTAPNKPRQQLYLIPFRGSEHSNSVLIQIALVIKNSMIAKIMRRGKFGHTLQPLTGQKSHECRIITRIPPEPHARAQGTKYPYYSDLFRIQNYPLPNFTSS